jgi:hypothetical protein
MLSRDFLPRARTGPRVSEFSPILSAFVAALLVAPLPAASQTPAKSAPAMVTGKADVSPSGIGADSLAKGNRSGDTAALKSPAPVPGHTALPSSRTANPQQTAADSLRRVAKRDSFAREIAVSKAKYLRFPSSPDSIFGVGSVGPWYFLHSDAIGLSEAARIMPAVVAVPYSLSSGVNRFMAYGFPLLPNAVYFDDNVFSECPTGVSGTDNVFSTGISSASCDPPKGIEVSEVLSGLVIPQTDLLWENGVFGENVLGVRFARPLTQTIDFALFSNYRYFAPYTYGTAGDMTSLFDYFMADTSMLENGGRNPLSSETNMCIALASRNPRWGNPWLTYSYEDAKNDLAYQQIDTNTRAAMLQWETLWRYANTVRAQVRSLPLGRFMLNADGRAVFEGHTVDVPNENTLIAAAQKTGRNTDAGLSVEPFLPFPSDTLLVTCTAQRQERLLYNQSKTAAEVCDVRAGYRHGFSFPVFNASVKATVGDGVVASGERVDGHSLLYSADISAAVGRQTLHLYAMRDHLPYVLPYDTLGEPLQSYYDVYNSYGAELSLVYKKVGLSTGVCGVSGIDTTAAARFWPDGVMPYRQPHFSFMVAPLLGRWLGFAVCSRLILADTKPFIKSQSAFSYEAQPLGVSEHITADLMYDYWSDRDGLSYGGINLWNRELNSLSLRIAVHIQGFNIFYKVDNILDRKYAYVPGYFMPGITFRWGFGWLIQ